MGKPKVRFKGYTDDWEQRKLGDLYFERNEKGNDTLQILSVSIHSGVSSEELDANDLGKTVRRSKDKTTYKHVYKGDLIFNMMRAWQGAIGVAQNEGMISPAYISAVPNNELYPPFMNYLLRRRDIIEQINNLSYGVTDFRKRLYWDSFVKIVCQIPELEEQKCITECFQELDHLITLHQRKCENAQKLKKYMLQKMFPKNGTNVPEIRFEGFKDAWEQRKFGEIVEKYEDPVETPTEGYTRLGIRSHAKGTFHSYVEKGKELETAKMFRVAADKFIVNITFGWEHAVAITNENDAGKLVSHRFPQYSFNAGMDPKFFRYLILDENFKHHLELSSPGGAGRNRVLKLNDMLQYKMNFPSEVEQKKIAAYFDDLDHLITLHQHKCEELKNIKKFMLQNMFVQEK